MPGAKGKSGGARPGAGRKPKPQAPMVKIEVGDMDMLALLQSVALGQTEANALQVRAAIAAVQYTHTKRGDGGVKDERQAKAEKAAAGRFSTPPPPKLVVNNA